MAHSRQLVKNSDQLDPTRNEPESFLVIFDNNFAQVPHPEKETKINLSSDDSKVDLDTGLVW